MEVAGVGISALGIAIQLADSVRKLQDFWRSVVDAPSHIQNIVDDLQLLENILKQIPADGNSSITLRDALTSCQKKIDALSEEVTRFETDFSSGSHRTRKWASIKAAWGSKGFEKSQELLNDAKSTLLLAQSSLVESQQRRLGDANSKHHEEHRDRIAQFENTMKDLLVQNCNQVTMRTSNSISKASRELRTDFQQLSNAIPNDSMLQLVLEQSIARFFASGALAKVMEEAVRSTATFKDGQSQIIQQVGHHRNPRRRGLKASQLADYPVSWKLTSLFNCALSIESTTLPDDTALMERENLKTETIIHFHPPQWLLKIGFSYGLNFNFTNCHRGWKHCLETFRCVPGDSLIFDFCKSGNIRAVETLIRAGKASVWDSDPFGLTPLHVAAVNAKHEMCKSLLSWGADPEARYRFSDFPWGTPLQAMLAYNLTHKPHLLQTAPFESDSLIETFRSFEGYPGLDTYAYYVVCYCLVLRSHFALKCEGSFMELTTWLLSSLTSIHFADGNMPVRTGFGCCNIIFGPHTKKSIAFLDRSARLVALDFVFLPKHSPFHHEYFNFMSSLCPSFIPSLLESIKSSRFNLRSEEGGPTLTTILMRSSYSFAKLRELLISLGVALEDYAAMATENHMPLALQGWTTESLFTLFKYQFQPIDKLGAFLKADDISEPISSRRSASFHEIWWCENVERIRRGLRPYTQPERVEFVRYCLIPKFTWVGINVKRGPFEDFFRFYGGNLVNGFDSKRKELRSWSVLVNGKIVQFSTVEERYWNDVDQISFRHERN